MKPFRPRREKPLFFSIRIYSREATILDVRDQALTSKNWHETMDIMDHKGALPPPSIQRNIKEMLEKHL